MADVLEVLGTPIDTNPAVALMDLIRGSAGSVAFLAAQVRELGHDLVKVGVYGDAVQRLEAHAC